MKGRSALRPPLFNGWWFTATGERLCRATVGELREANRLWWKHRDIRESGGVKRYAHIVLIDDTADGELEDEWTPAA